MSRVCGQDNNGDHNDERPSQEDDSYICVLTEPQTAEPQDSDEDYAEDYEMPSYADTMKPPPPQRVAKLQDTHLRGIKAPS